MKPESRTLLAGGICLCLVFMAFLLLSPGRRAVVGPATPQIVAGDGHAIALTADGRVYGWGFNNMFGQAGFGPTLTQWISPRIFAQQGSNWMKLAAGDNHSLGIKSDGSLWSWGRNDLGQMGIGRYDSTSSDSGMPSMRPRALRIGSETNWASIAGGVLFSAALKTDGSLWTWGGNWAGQLGNGTTGELHALFSNYDLAGQAPKTNRPTQVGEDRDWRSIAAGSEHVLALKSDGSLWAWGRNDCGQLGDGTVEYRARPTRIGAETNWVMIAAGGGFTGGHSVALKRDGSLWAWGNYCPRATNRIVMNAPVATRPLRLGLDTDWEKIVAGDGFTFAIKKDGSLWALGLDCAGVLGKVNATIKQLTRVDNGHDWVGAAVEGVGYLGGRDSFSAYGLKADGTLWAWGAGLQRPVGRFSRVMKTWLEEAGVKVSWSGPRVTFPARLLDLGVRETEPRN